MRHVVFTGEWFHTDSPFNFSICFACCILRYRTAGIEVCSFFMRTPLADLHGPGGGFVIMYYSRPTRLANSNKAIQNLCQFFNVICDGSPSRIRRVRRISLGITTRPRSSILRTIPVAFIVIISSVFRFPCYSLQKSADYAKTGEKGKHPFSRLRCFFMQLRDHFFIQKCAPFPGGIPLQRGFHPGELIRCAD